MGDSRVEAAVATGAQAAAALPGFDLFEQLGRGATTVVHRARRRGAGGPDVAVKMLRERLDDADAVAATYRREAALLARVVHPCVAAIHAAGEAAGHPYVVLELVDGVPLADLIWAGPLDELRTIRIATDAASALWAVHGMRLVHRDIKPQNLLVTDGDRAKLIDFDLATWAGELADDTAAGTLVYSAPEQNGTLARPVDGRADLYALGVVLFECVTGRPPFDTADVGELLQLHAAATPPDIHTLQPGCSPALAAVVHKLLAKDPDDRYQSARGLLADLRRINERPDDWPFTLDKTSTGSDDNPGPPFVEREVELMHLTQRWSEALRGNGGVAQVDGAVGSGKSRLVRELLRAVTGRGQCTLHARCTDSHIPLHALRGAVERHLAAVLRLPAEARAAAEQRIRQAARDSAPLLTDLSPALSAMLDARPLGGSGEDRQEQVAEAIASFLTELSRLEGGLLLTLDDAHHIDSTSARVLRHLAAEWETAPLLVVLTAPTDATAEVEGRLGAPPDLRVVLEPLSQPAVVDLIAGELGGADVSDQIVGQLTSRTDGNPFAVLEYLRHLVDAGGLQPSWGTWVIDAKLLDRLALPDNVIDLMLARLEGLGARTRHLLAAAAVQGLRFDATVAAAVSQAPDDFGDALAIATRHRIVEHTDGDVHAFVHVRLRDAVIDDVDWTALAGLHRRTAEALEAGDDGPEHVFQIAHHRMASGDEAAPSAFRACSNAGHLALAQHAPAQAVRYFAGALHAARIAGLDPDVGVRQGYASALLRIGDFSAAREQLAQALDQERDSIARATLLELHAKTLISEGEGDEAIAVVRRALAELGTPLPRSRVLLAASSPVRLIAGMLVGAFRYGRARGVQRERWLREASLLDRGTQAATLSSQTFYLLSLPMRGLLPANRVGRSVQRTRILAALGITIAAAGARRLGARICSAADREANALADAGLIAMTTSLRAVIDMMTESSSRPLLAHLELHGRWLELTDYLLQIGIAVPLLTDDGYVDEAETWLERARKRLGLSGSQRDTFIVECLAASTEATRGRAAKATADLRAAVDALGTPLTTRQQSSVARATLTTLIEQNEFGDAFDDAVAQVEDVGIPDPGGVTLSIDYAVAFGRLAQADLVHGDDRERRLGQAGQRIRRLARYRGDPRSDVGRHALQAWALLLRGRPRAAQRRVHRAYRAADHLDAPAKLFDLLRIHARILAARGCAEQARQRARLALSMAVERGWEYRARWISDEFALRERGGERGRTGGRSTGRTTTGDSDARQRRRFEALQQISATAASVLDPEELIRVTLDVTLRLLSADRAFLFLQPDPDTDVLQPHVGCDADGNILHTLADYSSTLVHRVHETGEALVVTGSEQGAALGSQSAVVHGLRSILVAPLQLKGRQLGVFYLDSRVARGVFTTDDVEMLVAITHQVAASLETARAARLDAEIRAANRQRDLAQTLQASMADLNATLDPDEVLRRLLQIVVTTLPASQGLLFRHGPGQLVATAQQAAMASAAPVPCDGPAFDLGSHPTLHSLSERNEPLAVDSGSYTTPLPPELADLLDEPHSWLAIPIVLAERRFGLVVVGSDRQDSYTDVEVRIAAVLGDQGAAAYERAQLYSRAHEAATVDELTQVATRRHFWQLAEQHHASALRHDRPLAAMMLDIDHFKRVNDTYGHAVGDAVLRQVAERIRETVRRADIVGRYGGEEFAMLLPETTDVAPLGERLRTTIAGTEVPVEGRSVSVTVSIGISYLRPGDDLDSLLARADTALYRSKHEGRNRVTVT